MIRRFILPDGITVVLTDDISVAAKLAAEELADPTRMGRILHDLNDAAKETGRVEVVTHPTLFGFGELADIESRVEFLLSVGGVEVQ